MSDIARRTDPPKRYRPGDPILARDLTKIVEFVAALDKRSVLAALDGGAWHRCRSEVDAPSFSVLGVKDIEIDYDGVTIVVEEVTQEHENLVANEEYPLFAGVMGHVKLINDRDLCLVNVYEPFNNEILYRYDLAVYNKEVVLPGFTWTGTGTGSGTGSGSGPLGTGGVTPSCDLWAMSAVNQEGRCYVQAGLNPRLLLFQSTGGAGGDLVYGPHDADRYVGQFNLANRETRVVDYTRTYEVDCRDSENLVFPYDSGVMDELDPLTTVKAEYYNGRYYAVSGGAKHFFGEVTAGAGGSYTVVPEAGVFGDCEALSSITAMFGESYLLGSGVLVVVIGKRLYALASDCAYGIGTGTGT